MMKEPLEPFDEKNKRYKDDEDISRLKLDRRIRIIITLILISAIIIALVVLL